MTTIKSHYQMRSELAAQTYKAAGFFELVRGASEQPMLYPVGIRYLSIAARGNSYDPTAEIVDLYVMHQRGNSQAPKLTIIKNGGHRLSERINGLIRVEPSHAELTEIDHGDVYAHTATMVYTLSRMTQSTAVIALNALSISVAKNGKLVIVDVVAQGDEDRDRAITAILRNGHTDRSSIPYVPTIDELGMTLENYGFRNPKVEARSQTVANGLPATLHTVVMSAISMMDP